MSLISAKLRNSARNQECTFNIPGYPKYSIDRDGNVFGPRGRIKQRLDRKGYLRVQIYDETGRCRSALVHRLVAVTFIPNPDGLPQVNHIDEDKANPRVSNLEWCDRSHNIRHSRAVSGSIVDPEGNLHRFDCIEDIVAAHSLDQGNIVNVLLGKTPHHKGWRRASSAAIGVRFAGRVRGETTFGIVSADGIVVTGCNINEIAKAHGLCRIGLGRLIAGRLKSHRGWRLWDL